MQHTCVKLHPDIATLCFSDYPPYPILCDVYVKQFLPIEFSCLKHNEHPGVQGYIYSYQLLETC
jgi:hypothetical protein